MAETKAMGPIGVSIGPIQRGKCPAKTAKHVFRLLNCVGIRCKDIGVISICPETGCARVELLSKECEDYAFKVLNEVRSVMNIYDLRHLSKKPQNLKTKRLVMPGIQAQWKPTTQPSTSKPSENATSVANHQSNTTCQAHYAPIDTNEKEVVMLKKEPCADASFHPSAREEQEPPATEAEEQVFELISLTPESSSSLSQVGFFHLEEDDTLSKKVTIADATTSTSELPEGDSVLNETEPSSGIKNPDGHLVNLNKEATERPIMISAKTSTNKFSHCFCQGATFYHRLQTIETVVDNVHFDLGNIVTEDLRAFRMLIGRYVCALLNSGGGAVYFGVDGDKRVLGICVTQRYEDAVRLDIDSQIKLISPDVPTSIYKVNFAKVMDTTGHLLPDIKVLEVGVDPPDESGVRYTFKNMGYTWKDGQVQ